MPPTRDGAGLRIAVAASRFNDHVTLRLLDGVRRGLAGCGVRPDDVTEVWVPGAFELPLAARTLVAGGQVDAVVCVGCVIRGDTYHFELVAEQCAAGVQRVALDTGVPGAVRRPHHRHARPGPGPLRARRRPQRGRGSGRGGRRDGPAGGAPPVIVVR